jgi:hypothetical protein
MSLTVEDLESGSTSSAEAPPLQKASYFGVGAPTAPMNSPLPRRNSTRVLELQSADDADWDDDDNVQVGGPRVPRLSEHLVLNRDGNFVEHVPSSHNRTSTATSGKMTTKTTTKSTHNTQFDRSTQKEDAIMDRLQQKRQSYIEVSSHEKHAVFMLPAVRRSMRPLKHSEILMSDEVLLLQNRYMEMGPSRASLMHIGYDSLQIECDDKHPFDELAHISPLFRIICGIRGYHWLGYILFIFAGLCELLFFAIHISRHGVDPISGPALLMSGIFFLTNAKYAFGTTFLSHPLTHDVPIDEVRITGICYLRLVGLDVLSKAQKKLVEAASAAPPTDEEDAKLTLPAKNGVVEPEADLSLFRKKIVRSCLLEALTLHFLIAFIPGLWSIITTAIRSHERDDTLILALSIVTIYSRLVECLALSHVSFLVRLSQKLSEFEIRRVESDIRTCVPSLTHRITPRFKSMLHECHLVGNRAHSLFFFVLPILFCNCVQFLGAVMEASFGKSTVCVPAWVFFALFQPLVTLICFLHNYGLLNLAIERDIDQDIVEMNIRLTYSDSHVPNWLLQQLICLERLDGRAFSLPAGLVPSVEMSRQLASSVLTGCVILAPYLLSIFHKLSAEVLCLER